MGEQNNAYKRERYKNDSEYREREKKKARRRWTNRATRVRFYKYGLTDEQYSSILLKQKGLCAIGGEPLPEKPHVDHDHETGLVRGLTCRTHNVGLGMFGEDWELLEAASQYVFNAKVRYLNEQH